MTITGVHLEPVPANSDAFAACAQLIGFGIAKLYRLEYTENVPRNLTSAEWSPIQFFHGTGHCGCVARHVNQTMDDTIETLSWCSSPKCAVRGILNDGYVFQNYAAYARNKAPGQRYHGIFLCQARNFTDLHPVFLAIVRN
ncbi:hypothetical protein BGZ93_008935 [Podila epicladia]|nr:hypothetical protein BGZ92_003087 [Podila epicladia]KAG0099156.1 hypothetical protein BGZ93_008935 [Podila epicladia]